MYIINVHFKWTFVMDIFNVHLLLGEGSSCVVGEGSSCPGIINETCGL